MSCVNGDVPACGFISVHTPQAGAESGIRGSGFGIRTGSSNPWTEDRGPWTETMPAQLFRKLVQRIREEFEDAPNLRMTVSEATRFWALDFATCERVLKELLRMGFLAKGADERYGLVTVH